MSPYDFELQLRRLAVLSPKLWTADEVQHRQDYIAELRRAFMALDSDLFRVAMDLVIDTHSSEHVLPKPARIRECVEITRARRAASAPDRPPLSPAEIHAAMLENARSLSPRAAQQLLEDVGNNKTRFSDDVMQILLERASASSPTPETSPQGDAR